MDSTFHLLCSACTEPCWGLQEILDALVSAVTIIGGAVAVWVYRQDHLRKKAEWMNKLYEKFYENPQFKPVRHLMDHEGVTEEWLAQSSNEELLIDYLNFFEHIASLHTMGQISTEEIDRMFDYYLRLISEQKLARAYVKKWGFEDLERLLTLREGLSEAASA